MKKTCILILMAFLIAITSSAWKSPGAGRSYTLLQLCNTPGLDLERPSPTKMPQTYTLLDSLIISAGDTLVIENEDVLCLYDQEKYTGNSMLVIHGAVTMNPKDSAVFCLAKNIFADAPVNPGYILFETDAAKATLENLIFEGVAVHWLSNNPVEVRNCTFRNIFKRKSFSIIGAEGNGYKFIGNSFSDVKMGAITVNGRMLNGKPTPAICGIELCDNTILNCGSESPNFLPVIDLLVGRDWPVIVKGNTIIGSETKGGGIRVANGFSVKGDNKVTIEDNHIENMAYGICIDGGCAPRIINNKAINNRYGELNFVGFYGFGIKVVNCPSKAAGGETAYLQGNTIEGSFYGLYIAGSSTNVNAGNVNDPSSPDYNPGLNSFESNGFILHGQYPSYNIQSPCDVYNKSPNVVYAQGNIWGGGATTEEEIGARIIDNRTDPSFGKVIYMPAYRGDNSLVLTEADGKEIIGIYDLSGKLCMNPGSGVYVITYSDGSTKKLILK